MHLVEYVNYEIKPTQEALLIKPIRKLYNQDRSKTKDKFLQALSVLYFYVDPRSSYSYIVDDADRLEAIIEQEGLPSNFKITGDLADAMECYRKHCTTASSLLLQTTKMTIENMRKNLNSIDYGSLEEKDKVTAMKNIAAITQMIPKIVKDLSEAERAVEKEIEEQGTARGGNESKSLMDDGILMLE